MSEGQKTKVKIDTNSIEKDKIQPGSELEDVVDETSLDVSLIAGFNDFQLEPEILEREEFDGLAVPLWAISNKEAFYGHPLKDRDKKRANYCLSDFLTKGIPTIERFLKPIESFDADPEVVFISSIFNPIKAVDRMACLCDECWTELKDEHKDIEEKLQDVISDLPDASVGQLQTLDLDPRVPKEKKNKLMENLKNDLKESRKVLINEMSDFLAFYGKKQKKMFDGLSELEQDTSFLFSESEGILSRDDYLSTIGLEKDVIDQFSNVYLHPNLKRSFKDFGLELDVPVGMSVINDSSNFAVKIAREQPKLIYAAPGDIGGVKKLLDMIETWS